LRVIAIRRAGPTGWIFVAATASRCCARMRVTGLVVTKLEAVRVATRQLIVRVAIGQAIAQVVIGQGAMLPIAATRGRTGQARLIGRVPRAAGTAPSRRWGAATLQERRLCVAMQAWEADRLEAAADSGAVAVVFAVADRIAV